MTVNGGSCENPETEDVSKMPETYIFNAYFKDGEIASKLTPMTDTVLVLERVINGAASYSAAFDPCKQVVMRTDKHGKLMSLVSPTEDNLQDNLPGVTPKDSPALASSALIHSAAPPGDGEVKSHIVVPPIDAVSFLASDNAGKGTSWAEDLVTMMSDYKTSTGLHPIKLDRSIPFGNLQKPDKHPKTDAAKTYKKWYSRLNRDEYLTGYTLAKIRVAIFVINDAIPIDILDRVSVIRGDGEELFFNWQKDNSTGYHIGVLSGTKVTLPEGVYKLTINLDKNILRTSENSAMWNSLCRGGESSDGSGTKTYSYRQAAWIKFDIKNPAGEFDIINCDPISVEEAVIKQYPRFYSHLVSAAKDLKNDGTLVSDPSSKIIAAENEGKAQPHVPPKVLASGFTDFAKSWAVVKEKSQLAVNLSARDLSTHLTAEGRIYNGKKALTWDIAKAIHKNFEKQEDAAVRASLDFGFATKDGVTAWQKLYDAKKAAKAARDAGTTATIGAALADEFIRLPAITQTSLNQHGNSVLGKIGVPKIAVNLFSRATALIDLYGSTSDVVKSGFNIYFKDIPNLDDAIKQYSVVAKDYFDILGTKEILSNVTIQGLFDLGSSVLSEDSKAEIVKSVPSILAALEENTDAKIEVVGYTCDIGTVEDNQTLSLERAKSVEVVLIGANVSADRITVVGLGELDPQFDNISEENREKNRRMEIRAFTSVNIKEYPSREGMDTLERYRNITIQRSLKIDVEKIKAAIRVTDVALGIMSVIPPTQLIALAVIGLKLSYDAVLSLGKAVDEFVGDDYLAQYFKDAGRVSTMGKESRTNQKMIVDLFSDYKKNKNSNEEGDEKALLWAAQYRLRAEAIAGLVGLLMRAAIGADKDDEENTYEKRIEKYYVHEYIKNFLLNDQWAYPLNGVSVLKMDSYWLYVTNESRDDDGGHAKKARQDSAGLDESYLLIHGKSKKTGDLMALKSFEEATGQSGLAGDASGAHMMVIPPTFFSPNTLSAQFQGYFPIQYFGTKSITKFGETFNPVFSNYHRSNYYQTIIYYEDDSGSEPRWLPCADNYEYVNAGRNGRRRQYSTIRPFTPIRVLVVFDKDMAPLVPLSFALTRTDGINDTGPRYKSMASVLTKSDLLSDNSELEYEGMVGCVFYPFFTVGKKTYRGLKPLAGKDALRRMGSAKEYYDRGHLSRMRYSITCYIGDNEDTSLELPLRSTRDSDGRVKADKDWFNAVDDEIYVRLDTDKHSSEKVLLESTFLSSSTSSYEHAKLFSGDEINLRVAIRVGAKERDRRTPYTMDTQNKLPQHGAAPQYRSIFGKNEFKANAGKMTFSNFDWRTPVEFVFIVTCSELRTEGYGGDTRHNSMYSIPSWVNLCELGLGTFEFSDSAGPQLEMSLEYMGKVTRNKVAAPVNFRNISYGWHDDGFKFSPEMGGIRRNIRPIYDMLSDTDNKEKARAMVGWQGGSDNRSKESFVYAAYVRCNYVSPKAVSVDSIRPFGSGVYDDDYIQYAFKNFVSIGKSGANFSEVKNDSGQDVAFQFSTPDSFLEDVPWADPMSDATLKVHEKILSDDEIAEFTSKKISEKNVKDWLKKGADASYSPVHAFENRLKKPK